MTGPADNGTGFGSDHLDEQWRVRVPSRHSWGSGPFHPGHIAAVLGLFWLAYPISAMFGDHSVSTLRAVWVLVLAALSAGTILYVLFDPEDDDDAPPTTRQIVTIVAILSASDIVLSLGDRPEWAAVLTVYVIAFAAIPVGGMRSVVNTALGVVGGFLLMLAGGMDLDHTLTQTLTLGGLGVTLLAIGNVVRSNRALRNARVELAKLAVEDERSRFARDLHDLLGHSLSMIAIKARLAQKLAESDPARAAQELADIEHAARTSLTEVREAVTGYRRSTIAGELAGARLALESAGVQMHATVTRMPLGPEDEAVIAWALREATTNVVRHSGASAVTVRIEPAGAGARLLVDDDGGGSAADGEGNGLRGLAERVAARRGQLETGSRDCGGYRVAVTLPGVPAT